MYPLFPIKSMMFSKFCWRQAIIWTNADSIYWRIYAALWGDELKPMEIYVLSNFSYVDFPRFGIITCWAVKLDVSELIK